MKWLVKSNYGTYLFVEIVNSPVEAREGGHGTLDDVMIVQGVPLESVERICARLLELLVHASCPKYIVLKDCMQTQ